MWITTFNLFLYNLGYRFNLRKLQKKLRQQISRAKIKIEKNVDKNPQDIKIQIMDLEGQLESVNNRVKLFET